MRELVRFAKGETMPEDVVLHVIRKSEFAAGRILSDLDDPGRYTVPTPRVRRMLLNNPLSYSDDDPVQVFASVGRQVVGRSSLLHGQAMVRGEPTPLNWGFDLLVLPAARGRGVGTRLVKYRQELSHTVAGCGLAPLTLRIYRRLQWVEFTMPTYVLVNHSRRFAEGYLGRHIGSTLLSGATDSMLFVHRSLLSTWGRVRTRDLRLEIQHRMPCEFDRLLARQDRLVVLHRSAAWINWLLDSSDPEDQPNQRVYLVRDRRDKVVGYFVVRRRAHSLSGKRFQDVVIGTLKDWAVFDEERIDTLSIVLLAARELLSWEVDIVLVSVPDFAVGKALRKFGFVRKGAVKAGFHAVPPSPLVTDECQQQTNWRITLAEADNFYSA